MNDLIKKIDELTQEILNLWPSPRKIVTRVVKQMTTLNNDLATSYACLSQQHRFASARIISRPIFERSVFLEFILSDKDEMDQRARLFYHSSRLRQLLWVHYIIDDNDTMSNQTELAKLLEEFNQAHLANANETVNEWVNKQIARERNLFDRELRKSHYCSLDAFLHDDRRKGWYRTDPTMFSKVPKIDHLSDLARYVLNDKENMGYAAVYGLDSLYTHGYYADKWNGLGMMPICKDLRVTDDLVLRLCERNLMMLKRYVNVPLTLKKRINQLHRQIHNHIRHHSFKAHPHVVTPPAVNIKSLYHFETQVAHMYADYQWLRQHQQNHAARILTRTIFEQTVSLAWIMRYKKTRQVRLQLFILSSRIQEVANLRQLAHDDLHDQLSALEKDLKDQYDTLAADLMATRTIKRDKRRRHWYAIDETICDIAGQSVRTLRQVAHLVLKKNWHFDFLYANGFHSVHVHGINLMHNFKIDGRKLLLTGDLNDMTLSDQVIKDLWQSVKKFCKAKLYR